MAKESEEAKAEFLKFLKLAIATEREGVKFYTEVRRRTDDYNMNQLIKAILEQEREHLRIVTEVYNAEKSKGIEDAEKKAAAYKKQEPLKTPLSAMKHVEDVVKKKAAIHRVFRKAVEFEEEISTLYSEMAASTKNAKVKTFLKKLSDEEIGHKEFIMMHQESIYNSGHWYGWDHVRLEM